MVLEIRPRATETRVELDAFIACGVARAVEVEKAVREHLDRHKDRPATPFDASSHTDVLKLVATNLDSEGVYKAIRLTEEPRPEAGFHLVVTDDWAIFSRPRANNYLIDDLRRLRERLSEGCAIPPGPLALVSPPSDQPVTIDPVTFRGISSRGTYDEKQKSEELYFPLAYNNEQVTIVQRLERAAGVTVQGPPGTGKTHTIANIICHYIATGRRVLVTSRGEPALEVLQSKIPEEVRPLTVALLTSDREGIRQFQGSIEAIQHRVSQLNPDQTREEIELLQQSIDRVHAELVDIDRRINKIALAQLSETNISGAPMRAQRMAELVVSGRELYGWFDDELSLTDEHAPPLSEDEGGKLREYRRKLGSDLIYVRAKIPSADELPTVKEVEDLHNVLCGMREIETAERTGRLLPLRAVTTEVLAVAREMLDMVNENKSLVKELEEFGDSWPLELRRRCRQAEFKSERAALETLFGEIDVIVTARADFLKRPVDFPHAGLNSPKAKEAVNRGAETGKPFGLFNFLEGDAKQQIAGVRVAGLQPKGSADWVHVKRFLDLHEQTISFCVKWNQFAATLSIPNLQGGIGALKTIERTALATKKAHRLGTRLDGLLLLKAAEVFETSPSDELLGSSSDLDRVRQHLLKHLTRSELAQAAASLSVLQEKTVGCSGPVTDLLRQFIECELGNGAFDPNRIASKFAGIRGEIQRIKNLSVEISTVRDFAKRIEGAGAAKLASRLISAPAEQVGEDTIVPANWREAWNWARIKGHLDEIEGRNELVAMAARRRDLEIALSRLYKNSVAKSAWLATKKNSTQRVLQALAGYATAIRRIGQGTGPNAMRYRRDARAAMLEAAGAVPCWIMRHAKISESMPAEIGVFDLVIVDEASQSDLWALPAILRGKKILIVGDDKQVSPDPGFIASQKISELRNRFLSDQPYGVEMTPEKSLYDLAARVFAAEQVMLREHFRCVPPIISYSNRNFYNGAIQPIRIPRASERIDPPLVDIYVEDGVRDHQDRNGREAEVIAEEIGAILENKRLAGRTIGAISLLGMDQAKHIDDLVRRNFSATELLSRKFECGDARTFQGSERDIIFLSMVVDPRNYKAISGNMFEQRFNVAASRARDRMYLVRSVTSSLLSDRDLRISLLRHFDKPLAVGNEEAESLASLCESGFERDLYTELTDRGFRVVPQVKTGAYRIDMVVEGIGDTRLAIECDGDEFHGPDRWQHDMNRQRVLERAGWTFWRCFASTWLLHRADAIDDLLTQLKVMGIEPMGALDRIPSLVEHRTSRHLVSENDPVLDTVQDAIEDRKSHSRGTS